MANRDSSGEDLLVRAAAGGDRSAFGELVRCHQAKLLALLNYLTRDASVADDLAQQTLLRAWVKLGSFQGDTSARFGAWLARIAYREFLQWVRRGKRETALVAFERVAEGLAEESPETPSMTELLKPCSPEQSEALYMNFVLELTHEEIALITDRPLGTVKSHLARGKAAIKTALQARLHPAEPQSFYSNMSPIL